MKYREANLFKAIVGGAIGLFLAAVVIIKFPTVTAVVVGLVILVVVVFKLAAMMVRL